jgi:hypothetical protein
VSDTERGRTLRKKYVAGEALPASEASTGLATPGRSVCAPEPLPFSIVLQIAERWRASC